MKKYFGIIVTMASILFFGLNSYAVSDSEITEIMETANKGEIDAAKVAVKKAQNDSVKAFAEMMIKEHGKNKDMVKDLSKSEKIKMTSSEDSKMLKKDALAKVSALKKTEESQFDKAYIGTQVAMHQKLFDDLNQKLIPAAKNEKLKNYLEETKSHVEAHLKEAKELQSQLQ